MDGNGRWAKEKGKERVYGHFEGVESVRACVEAAIMTGVKYLSLYAFSEENWGRPQEEVDALMGLMIKAMAAEMPSLERNGVRFMVIGNRERLAPELNEVIDSCMARTAANTELTFIIFLSYSGKWDILQAAKKMTLELAEHPSRRFLI
jgi:undecaprenyl diphosphate synthase